MNKKVAVKMTINEMMTRWRLAISSHIDLRLFKNVKRTMRRSKRGQRVGTECEG
jgi:hypothetical protein